MFGGETVMQILELVLYGKNGQKRTLSFKPGKVNIIPGESKAGKSAVGDIIAWVEVVVTLLLELFVIM